MYVVHYPFSMHEIFNIENVKYVRIILTNAKRFVYRTVWLAVFVLFKVGEIPNGPWNTANDLATCHLWDF